MEPVKDHGGRRALVAPQMRQNIETVWFLANIAVDALGLNRSFCLDQAGAGGSRVVLDRRLTTARPPWLGSVQPRIHGLSSMRKRYLRFELTLCKRRLLYDHGS